MGLREEGDARRFAVLHEHLRLALKWPRAERVMGSAHVGPNAERCIHDQFMAVFCPECAAFFCSMPLTEIKALAEPFAKEIR